MAAGTKAGANRDRLENELLKQHEFPFDSDRSQHNATLGRFLKTSSVPLADCVLLLAVGAIPLLILEIVKIARHGRRQNGRVMMPGSYCCSGTHRGLAVGAVAQRVTRECQ